MIGEKISGKDGKVKFGNPVNLSGIAYANGVVTINFAAAHNLQTGDRVVISGVVGMTDLNRSFTCTVVDADTITVPLVTAQAYTNGGSAQKCIEITKWDLTKSADTQDVTDSSDSSSGWKSNIPSGWKSFSGSFEGFLYAGTLLPLFGSKVAVELTANNSVKYAGNVIINSEAVNLGVVGNEAVKISFQIIGDGSLTKTDTTA